VAAHSPALKGAQLEPRAPTGDSLKLAAHCEGAHHRGRAPLHRSKSDPFEGRQQSAAPSCKQTSQQEEEPKRSPRAQVQQANCKTGRSSAALAVCAALVGLLVCLGLGSWQVEARVTFEKMTNRDYSGLNYYTIQNVSLFECLGWCKEETSCTSAVFSFVVNPFAALQETTCMLQNETQARQGAYLRPVGNNGDQITVVAQPQKATNLYFFNKIELQTEAVCSRLWAFERFPNRRLRQQQRSGLGTGSTFHAASKEACQAACMNEQRFVCRSLEYNHLSQQCLLSANDRRSPLVQHLASSAALASGAPSSSHSDLIEAPGVDYFENACLLGEDICNESRIYDYAKVGLPLQRVAHFVELNYYPDKEMLVKSQAGCVRACTIEHEFICRSILYRSTFKQGQPNCALYHLDQRTFPEGADAFSQHSTQPLLDSGETSAVYLEAVCNDTIASGGASSMAATMQQQQQSSTITMPPSSITIMPSSTTPGGLSVYPSNNNGNNMHNSTTAAELERFIGATSTLSPLAGGPPTIIRLPTSFLPPSSVSLSLGGGAGGSGPSSSGSPFGSQGATVPANIQLNELPPSAHRERERDRDRDRMPSHITISPAPPPHSAGSSASGQAASSNGHHQRQPGNHQQQQSMQGSMQVPSHITISPPPGRDTSSLTIEPSGPTLSLPVSSSTGPPSIHPSNHDQNCDAHGFCYDVALKCTDTKMVVNVKTQRPFFGRIYALGRSETCNANIKNQNQFQLDMWLTGQECNTQSAVSYFCYSFRLF